MSTRTHPQSLSTPATSSVSPLRSFGLVQDLKGSLREGTSFCGHSGGPPSISGPEIGSHTHIKCLSCVSGPTPKSDLSRRSVFESPYNSGRLPSSSLRTRPQPSRVPPESKGSFTTPWRVHTRSWDPESPHPILGPEVGSHGLRKYLPGVPTALPVSARTQSTVFECPCNSVSLLIFLR